MTYLSLFSGAMGGDLGLQYGMKWTCKGYVENDDYCQKLIRMRQDEGSIDRAPIFGDVRAFICQGYAASYSGMVDVISAGFPCQPFSVAGTRRGGDDERNMWPATIECIRLVRPRYAFLENVPGLLAHPYIRTIFGDLAEAGYDAEWMVLGADDCGAQHRRKRVWILANASSGRCGEQEKWQGEQSRGTEAVSSGEDVADASSWGLERSEFESRLAVQFENTSSIRARFSGQGWWDAEPDVGRVAHGVASRVDRIKAIGNGQVPQCTASACDYLLMEMQ